MVDVPEGRVCHVLDQILTSRECRDIIDAAEQKGFMDAGTAYPPAYRNNDRQLLDDPQLAATMFERLRHLLPEQLDGARLVGLNERFRVCRYRDNQRFSIHQDGAWHPDDQTASRLTLMLYLNDDTGFSGGSTRFFTHRGGPVWKTVRPAAGRLALFDHRLWHDGQRVRGGTKYILRTDVIYRKRRTESGHRGYVWAVQALPGGRLATAGRDQTIRLWRGGRCERVMTWHPLSALALAVDADGALWSGGRDASICREGQLMGSHEGAVLSLCAHGDSVYSGGADGIVRRWPGGEVVAEHQGWVRALCVQHGSIVSGSEDGTVAVAGQVRWRLGAEVWSLCTIGAEIVAGLSDGRICALHAGTVWPAHEAGVRALCAHNGVLISGGEDARVRWWAGAECVAEEAAEGFVSGLAVGGGRVWCAGYGGLVALRRGGAGVRLRASGSSLPLEGRSR